jgi:L-aspartate semialdehyde sulfurtransferase ferredoxin
MAVQTVELNARQDRVGLPIVWRLGKLFNVVPNLRRARVTEDFAYALLDLEGSTQEVEQAVAYLRALGLTGGADATPPLAPAAPEAEIDTLHAISLRLTTVNPQQTTVPVLYRIGKDFEVVVYIDRAQFDEEEGGWVEITIAGPLIAVQRAIAYLHTTGLHVYPFQRSVSDNSNL